MSSTTDRTVAGLVLVIHRDRCAGFARCVGTAPAAFSLDDDGGVRFASPESVDRETLLAACRACPGRAIEVFDAGGNRLVP